MDLFHGLSQAQLDGRCEKLQAPSYLNLALSILILLGILLSYLPQHHRIISRGTSEGISPFFILLGTTSSTSAFANILVLPASRADVACCKSVSTFECTAGLLGIAQVGIQWFCFTIILLLFLVFFPRGTGLPESEDDDEPHKTSAWRTAVTIGIICVLYGLVVVITSAALIASRPQSLGTWANILGVAATVLAAIQYIPQILLTWNLGHIGSLSIPMMLIQTPGSFVWSASLAVRLGIEGWSTWGILLVTGCLQGFLLGLGIYYEIKARIDSNGDGSGTNGTCIVGYMDSPRRNEETDDEGGAVVESERRPLLSGSRKSSRSRAPA